MDDVGAGRGAVADPAAIVAALDARAERVETPCGDGRMVWRVWGAGPPLVLLHGGHGAWTHWLRAIPDLAADHRVIVPDMPGYGDSDVPPERDEPLAETIATVLAEGLDRTVGPGRYAIAGFSFGGVMGGHVAALRRSRVSRLVLLGAGGLALPRPPAPTLVKWRGLPDEDARREAHRANLAAVMLADPARVDALAVHLQAENTGRARRVSRSISLTDALRLKLEAIRDASGPRVPLAGIWGDRDAMTGAHLETRRALLAELDPEAPFVVLAGAGHWTPYERPEEVCAALRGILATPG